MFNCSCCNYSADTISIAVITVATMGFFILFSVMPLLKVNIDESTLKTPIEIIKQRLENPFYRYSLLLFESDRMWIFMLISQIYLFALLLCLSNYLISIIYEGCILLFCSLFLVLIATGLFVYHLSKALYKGMTMTVESRELSEFIETTKWLRSEK
jgi:DNA helicase HerA-like ATPase